jgi:predicted metal-binding protein
MEPALRSDDPIATFGATAAQAENPVGEPAGTGVTIVVCHFCRREADLMDYPHPGSRLHAAVKEAAAGTGIAVRRIGCLGNCKRGISAAILRDGAWSYVFGELTEESAADLVAGAALFAGSTDGFMPFRARPESLKRGLIARIPLIDHVKDAE